MGNKQKMRGKLKEYSEMDIEGMSDEEYEKVRKSLIKYSSFKISEGLVIIVIVIFIALTLKW